VRPVGGRIDLRWAPGEDRILVDVHASGREYLTSGDGVEELRRHRFEDDQVIDRLPAAALSASGPEGQQDLWSLGAGYLTDEVLLASVQSEGSCWHVLVRRRPMQLLGRVDYGLKVWAPGGFKRASGGTWTTSGDTGIQRWKLAEDPASGSATSRVCLKPPSGPSLRWFDGLVGWWAARLGSYAAPERVEFEIQFA
jgi:hypothetical protein